MFSRYYTPNQARRYRQSPHKARIDHVAGSLVAQRYLDVVVADHLREWLRLVTFFGELSASEDEIDGAPLIPSAYVARHGGQADAHPTCNRPESGLP